MKKIIFRGFSNTPSKRLEASLNFALYRPRLSRSTGESDRSSSDTSCDALGRDPRSVSPGFPPGAAPSRSPVLSCPPDSPPCSESYFSPASLVALTPRRLSSPSEISLCKYPFLSPINSSFAFMTTTSGMPCFSSTHPWVGDVVPHT